MNSEEQEIHERGDSDDEIAELRFQALLTKKENEAEISPSHKSLPLDNTLTQVAINQPLSNFHGQPFNFRGRGNTHYYNKPYLQTFSQQIASKSVNSNNIVVLTSSDPDDLKPSFGSEWSNSGRGGYVIRGGRWPRGGGRGVIRPNNAPPMAGSNQAPPLVLPQDKYTSQQQNTQESSEQNKLKLSARMRRLQCSDSDSEDSESDSSDDSSTNTSSSDSNSSSSDSSSSGSDSDSDNSRSSPAKKTERISKKTESGKHSTEVSTEHGNSSHNQNFHNHSNSKNIKSPVKTTSKQLQTTESNKPFHPPFGKEGSRSPVGRRPGSPKQIRSCSKSPSYSQKPKSPPIPRVRRSTSFSPRPRGYSRSRRSRTPIRRYGSRSPARYRGSKSPRLSKSPSGRYRSHSRSPYYEGKRFRSRSPYLAKRALSPPLRRSSRSPLPPRRFSRSPAAGRIRSRSPKRYGSRSPRPMKRYGSITPPGRSYRSRSPYGIRRYGSRSPRPYSKRISPGSPKRYRSISPRNARSPPFMKEILHKSPRISRKSSFSPPTKRWGSRSPFTRGKDTLPFRSNRSPLFQERGRSPIGAVSSPRRIKRIGSLSPKPLLDPSDKFLRGHSPYRSYPRSPPVKRYGTPPLRRLSPDFKMSKHLSDIAVDMKEDLGSRNHPFVRTVSPRGHNFTNRSPSPYFRNRTTPPGIQAVERNFLPGSQSPLYYGSNLHFKMNRNIPFEKEMGQIGKRFPGDHPPPQAWIPHKSELGLPQKELLGHPYPPKFMDAEYGERPGYLTQHPPPPLLEKPWPPGPPNRGMSHFGNGRGQPRLERLDLMPPHMIPERGRGRGFRGLLRGQRGVGRGVHTRLGRGLWTAQHQGPPPPLYETPPPYDDPYLREKPFRIGIPPPLSDTQITYLDRKQSQPCDIAKPLLPLIRRKSISPERLQRVPRGPKTPPYSPNREPSPIEWEKRARANVKPRSTSRSPSTHRYGIEASQKLPSLYKQRERTMGTCESRSHSESTGGHRVSRYRSRSPYAKDEQTYRMNLRKEPNIRRAVDERKKVTHTRNEEHNYKSKDSKRAHPSDDISFNSNDKLSSREIDRRLDERHRTPTQFRGKGSDSYTSRSKDYESDIKVKKEREVKGRRDLEPKGRREHEDTKGRREQEDIKGRREHEDIKGRREHEDIKGRREHEDIKGRREHEDHNRRKEEEQKVKREIEDQRERKHSGDQKGRREKEDHSSRREEDERGRKEHNEIKNRKEIDEQSKGKKIEEDRKERRETEDEREKRENYVQRSERRHLDLEDNLKGKVEKTDEKKPKEERKKDIRIDETVKREKDSVRSDKKDVDKNLDKVENKLFDKHTDSRHRDERRDIKDTHEHDKSKDNKEPNEKLTSKGHEEKKRKKKKHKEDDRSSSKSSKKKKKEKKKKKDSKKQKKKSKDFGEELDVVKKKKKTQEHSSGNLSRPEGDLRYILVRREDRSRSRGNLKRKDGSATYEGDDRDNRKRRKDTFIPSTSTSVKDEWKWRGGGQGSVTGRDIDRRKDDREPPPPLVRERTRMFSSSDKRNNESTRGGKGLYVTVNSSIDRHVSSSKDVGTKESGSRLPVHMRLGGKSKDEKVPLTSAVSGAMKGGKKGDHRLGGEGSALGGRRKIGGSQQQRRQGMKGGMGSAKRANR